MISPTISIKFLMKTLSLNVLTTETFCTTWARFTKQWCLYRMTWLWRSYRVHIHTFVQDMNYIVNLVCYIYCCSSCHPILLVNLQQNHITSRSECETYIIVRHEADIMYGKHFQTHCSCIRTKLRTNTSR